MAAGWPTKANYATGDVLSATNMNDLSGTVNLINPSAKGDLYAGSAANTYTKLTVGANNTVLTADSSTATGLKWAAAGGASALTKITAASFSAVANTGTTFDGIFTSTYKRYLVILNNLNVSLDGNIVKLNTRVSGTTQSTNYYGCVVNYSYTAALTTVNTNNGTYFDLGPMSDQVPTLLPLYFSNVGNTSERPTFGGLGVSGYRNGPSSIACNNFSNQTADGIILTAASGTITGTVTVYGLAN